jgi:transcriptional regulator with XRE-family HTH domain
MAEHIGTRIAYWRRRRGGLTQATLGGLAGVSQAYISQVEAGRKPVDKRSTLIAIADALQVTVADLLETPGDPADPQRDRADTAVPAIRVVLAEIEEGERRPALRGPEEMAAAVAELSRRRVAADYPGMATMLTTLLPDAAAYGGVYLARVAYETATCLKNLGYRDLALPASRIGVAAARDADDPAWIGATSYFHTIALPLEAPGLSTRAAVRFVGELQGRAADVGVRQMLGQLHVSAALTSAIDGRAADAAAHLTEAKREALTLGDPDDGVGFNNLCFGPTNVGLWEMTVAAESGEHGQVVELAQTVEPRRLKPSDRSFSYWSSYGRALAQSSKTDRQALVALVQAERSAPAAFARSQVIRDTVVTLTYRARHRAVSAELRTLSRRVGIDTPA